jgi:primase-like protein
VLPPSQHVSGNRYTWQTGCGLETALAPLPSWISIALKEKRYDLNAVGQPGAAWHELVAGNVSEGKRNNTITQLTGHLLRHYVDPRVVLELMLSWNATRCDPPLSPAEVAKTVNSIANRELKRREKK